MNRFTDLGMHLVGLLCIIALTVGLVWGIALLLWVSFMGAMAAWAAILS